MKKISLRLLAIGVLLVTQLFGCANNAQPSETLVSTKVAEQIFTEPSDSVKDLDDNSEETTAMTEAATMERESTLETETETETIITERETLANESIAISNTYDLKEYSDILPEDLGGNLSATLASILYPDNPVFSYDEEWPAYTLGDGDMRIFASDNNDGYFVWVLRQIEGFSVYGVRVGMTEEVAAAVLEKQGILYSDGNYMITDDKYLMFDSSDGIINGITFAHHIRSNNPLY